MTTKQTNLWHYPQINIYHYNKLKRSILFSVQDMTRTSLKINDQSRGNCDDNNFHIIYKWFIKVITWYCLIAIQAVLFIENNCAYRKSTFRYPFIMYEQTNYAPSKRNYRTCDNRNINPDGTYEMNTDRNLFVLYSFYTILYLSFSIRNYHSL